MTALPLTPAGLRCAHQADPLGVAPDRVRLSWRLDGTGTGRVQRAYQVLVTDEDRRCRVGQRPGGVRGRFATSPTRVPADGGRPVPLAGAGLGRGRAGV